MSILKKNFLGFLCLFFEGILDRYTKRKNLGKYDKLYKRDDCRRKQ